MSKAQQLLEEVRKRKEAEAAAAAAGDTGTSALDELMGGITGLDTPDATTPDTATPENEVTTEGNPAPAQDDGFITIVPEAPVTTGIQVEVEDAPAVTEQAPVTETPPAPEPAPKARRQTKQAPKVTETHPAPEAEQATDAPMTMAQKRTLEEMEAGRRLLAERNAQIR